MSPIKRANVGFDLVTGEESKKLLFIHQDVAELLIEGRKIVVTSGLGLGNSMIGILVDGEPMLDLDIRPLIELLAMEALKTAKAQR